MKSRQYLVFLVRMDRLLAWRVYSDRSVEWGYIEQGEFRSRHNQKFESSTESARDCIAQNLRMARDFGYKILREDL